MQLDREEEATVEIQLDLLNSRRQLIGVSHNSHTPEERTDSREKASNAAEYKARRMEVHVWTVK